jgi:DNA-binding SARP family transcriptional activator
MVRVDYRILGPQLEAVCDNGVRVRFRPHERELLTALLVLAWSPVSRETLVQALWGDSPPRNPEAALKTCVSRARTTLRSAGGCLKTVPGGYLADPAPQDLDLGRFRSLRAEGNQLIRQGQLIQASIKLGQALACWREPALVNLPDAPAINAQRTRLLEQQRATRLTLADVLLILGQQEDFVADWDAWTVADPGCEQVWEQFMLALDLSGRRSEALAAYDRASAALRPPSGPGPGAGLRAVHQAILDDRRPEELIIIPAQRIGAGTVPQISLTHTAQAG